jgi:hypothetical protein
MKNPFRWLLVLFFTITVLASGWWIVSKSSRSAKTLVVPETDVAKTQPEQLSPTPQPVTAAAPAQVVHRRMQNSPAPPQPTVSPLPASVIEKLNEELHEKPRYDEPGEAMEYYRLKRLPAGEKEIPVEKYLAAKAQMDAMPQYSTAQNRFLPSRNELKANRTEATSEALGVWEPLGPGNIGGRTRALLIHPTTPNVMYAAGVAGGVWKTTNAGALWQPLTDLMANIAVSCLAFDPSNPNVIYAGTGEGVFRSLDGGATWSKVLTYASGCLDLVIRTDQTTDYVFAACGSFSGGEIFRNTDAGGTGAWTSVHKETGMGRTSLALAPSNQNVIYALSASTLSGMFRDGLFAVFRSTSNGDTGTWTAQVRNNNPLKLNTILLSNPLSSFRSECGLGANSFSNQGWYDNVIAVDPFDENKVWAGGVDLFRSDDGNTRTPINTQLCFIRSTTVRRISKCSSAMTAAFFAPIRRARQWSLA